MNTPQQNLNWQASSEALSGLPGDQLDWLKQQREDSLAAYQKTGLPTVRDEEWRYTRLKSLRDNAFAIPDSNLAHGISEHGASENEIALSLSPTDQPRLVLIDGYVSPTLSNLDTQIDGLTIHSIAEILDSDSLDLSSILGSTLPNEQHGFMHLNSALFSDGYVIKVEKNRSIDTPIEIIHYCSGQLQQDQSAMIQQRNVIIAETNSQIRVIERHIGAESSVYLHNVITEILAADGAQVDHYKLQQESTQAFHMSGVYVKQDAHSTVRNHNIAQGALMARTDVVIALDGSGAHAEMNGLVLGKGRQHIDNFTEVQHKVAHCSSDEYYKTILNDNARGVFRGRILVAQDAQHTDAEQQNNNLLLSDSAEADSKPQLEIYADDVKCSHGATVGQLSEKSLFYLNSRGISPEIAQKLLTFAFANEVIERIQVAEVREELTASLAGEVSVDLAALL